MKISRQDDNIIFSIPFWTKRHNPYMDMEGEETGSHPTLVGIIDRDKFGNEELGFALVIDMDYKDKGDQNTDIMIHIWNHTEESFVKLCKELGVDVIKYPTCAYCHKAIYGCFTVGDKGNMCDECEKVKDEKPNWNNEPCGNDKCDICNPE